MQFSTANPVMQLNESGRLSLRSRILVYSELAGIYGGVTDGSSRLRGDDVRTLDRPPHTNPGKEMAEIGVDRKVVR